MPSTALSLTLNDDLPDEAVIIRHLSRFKSGKGNQYRSFEIKRLLLLAISTETVRTLVPQANTQPLMMQHDKPLAASADVITETHARLLAPIPVSQQALTPSTAPLSSVVSLFAPDFLALEPPSGDESILDSFDSLVSQS